MTGRLLWVDDEIDLLNVHIIFLQKKGYEVTTCSNGTDAIDLCRSGSFDLILLDENMPGLSGLETLAGIKEALPNVPVVMVTKNEAEDIMDQAIGSKIADYLLKPVNPMQILLTLKKNIHQREIVSEVTQTSYRQEFMQIAMQMDDSSTPEQWKELYKRLVYWELQLAETDGTMNEMLRSQKEEANQNFAKFVKKNYERWVNDRPEGLILSPDLFKTQVFPRLNAGRKVFLLVLDNFRFDQWRV
ncbi:MAG: response regulator, partial [Alloprevotella sp.]|nr:response regulator [Alloprevotella sp.]